MEYGICIFEKLDIMCSWVGACQGEWLGSYRTLSYGGFVVAIVTSGA